MNTYLKISLFILVITLLVSCEKDATIELPEFEPELVIASFISPQDDSVKVKLTWSKPRYYYEKDILDYEESATVIVSNGSRNYLLSYDTLQDVYISSINNFKTGDNIKIKVTYANEELISECKMPVKPLYEVEYLGKAYLSSGYYSGSYSKIKLICKNMQISNYYRVNFKVINNITGEFKNVDADVGKYFEMSYGESVEFNVREEVFSYDYNGEDSLIMEIINCDENYYRYHKTVPKPYANEGPFAEAVLIYDNVEGGIGIFCSYYLSKESFIIDIE